MKMKIQPTKTHGCSKIGSRGESMLTLKTKNKTRKTSNQQPNFIKTRIREN